MPILRQSTTQVIKLGPFLDSTDGVTPETALTIGNTDIRISKDGGNYAAKNSGGATHDEGGEYDATLNATDTNTVGELKIYVQEAGALPWWGRWYVVEEAIYDAIYDSGANGFDSSGRVIASQALILGSNSITAQSFQNTGPNAGSAQIFYIGSHGMGIFIDTSGGASGTTFGTDGREDNPCNSWSNAKTLAAVLGINRFYLKNGSSIILDNDVSDYEFVGIGEMTQNTIDLGSQTYSQARFINLQVTGTGNASSSRAQFEQCYLNGVTNMHCVALGCGPTGTITMTNNDDHVFDRCFSMVPGGGSPVYVMNANTDVGFRHASGGHQINDGGNTNDISLEGHGQWIVDGSCNNLTMHVRGIFDEDDQGTNTTIVEPDSPFGAVSADVISVNGDATAAQNLARIFGIGATFFTVGANNRSTTTCDTDLTEPTQEHYRGKSVHWLTGALVGQSGFVQIYAGSAAGGTLTFTEMTDIPAENDTGILI